jgi:hypothetical protein
MENKKIKSLSKLSDSLRKKHEKLRNEILNNENISEEVKSKINELKKKFEEKWLLEDKQIEENLKNGKKIIGYDLETFLPIFE